jgi:hypothetical protein
VGHRGRTVLAMYCVLAGAEAHCGRPLNWVVSCHAMSVRGFASAVLSAGLLCGCIGIGHIQVSVPEVEVNLRSSVGELTVDLVCANYYASPEAFAAVVSQSLLPRSQAYDWTRLRIVADRSRATCRSENRYIGFPAIALVPTAPSSLEAKSRHLFLHVVGSPNIFRVQIHGDTAVVDVISFDEAKLRYPPKLREPEPPILHPTTRDSNPEWSARIQLRMDYYSSLKWVLTKSLLITDLKTASDGAILSVTMEMRHDS